MIHKNYAQAVDKWLDKPVDKLCRSG